MQIFSELSPQSSFQEKIDVDFGIEIYMRSIRAETVIFYCFSADTHLHFALSAAFSFIRTPKSLHILHKILHILHPCTDFHIFGFNNCEMHLYGAGQV